MSDRPRTVWIGTDTAFVLEEFRNELTGQLITGVSSGTMDIYSGADDTLIQSLPLNENLDILGNYEALVPASQSGLSEGLALRLQFDITGGTGLTLRLDAKAVARVMKDDGL